MRTTIALLLMTAAGTAFGQYPYYPPAYGYWTKADAMRQQAFENNLRWQAEQRAQWRFWFGADPGADALDHGIKALQLRTMKLQERAMLDEYERPQPRRRGSAFPNPFLDE